MPKVFTVMSSHPATVRPEESLQRAAQLMLDLDVGALPVTDSGQRLLGMLTDRDIVVRGVAVGLAPEEGCVSDVMTTGAESVSPDQEVEDVLRRMGSEQVRRLPVVDAQGELVGIVSLGDLAARDAAPTQDTLREISTPGAPI